MATEKDAHKAREVHAAYLTSSGAHAILVDKIKRGKSRTYGVVAFYQQKPSEPLPDELEIESGGRKKKVPLAMRITPMATLE